MDDLEILGNHHTNLMDDTLDSSFDLNKDSNETSTENTINLENTELNDDTNDVEDENVNYLHTGSREGHTQQTTQQTTPPQQQIDSQEISKHINTLINKEPDTLEIKEVDIGMPEEEDAVLLKKPDTVYLDIYNKAVEKAKEARLKAIQAYLELKEIKNKYMIEEINDDEDENFPNFDF